MAFYIASAVQILSRPNTPVVYSIQPRRNLEYRLKWLIGLELDVKSVCVPDCWTLIQSWWLYSVNFSCWQSSPCESIRKRCCVEIDTFRFRAKEIMDRANSAAQQYSEVSFICELQLVRGRKIVRADGVVLYLQMEFHHDEPLSLILWTIFATKFNKFIAAENVLNGRISSEIVRSSWFWHFSQTCISWKVVVLVRTSKTFIVQYVLTGSISPLYFYLMHFF